MVRSRKKNKENTQAWLEAMREAIGEDVVVSVLVTNKGIEFISCVDRDRYFNSDDVDDGDDGEPEKPISKYKSQSLSDYGGYIQ